MGFTGLDNSTFLSDAFSINFSSGIKLGVAADASTFSLSFTVNQVVISTHWWGSGEAMVTADDEPCAVSASVTVGGQFAVPPPTASPRVPAVLLPTPGLFGPTLLRCDAVPLFGLLTLSGAFAELPLLAFPVSEPAARPSDSACWWGTVFSNTTQNCSLCPAADGLVRGSRSPRTSLQDCLCLTSEVPVWGPRSWTAPLCQA
eukprot:RCo026336